MDGNMNKYLKGVSLLQFFSRSFYNMLAIIFIHSNVINTTINNTDNHAVFSIMHKRRERTNSKLQALTLNNKGFQMRSVRHVRSFFTKAVLM